MTNQVKISSPLIAAVSPATNAQLFNTEFSISEYKGEKSQDFSIQCKLSIGAPDDPLEYEADAMADKVMRMPEQNFIQRKCTDCKEEDDHIQRKPIASFIQRKESSGGMVASDAVSNIISCSKGGGHRLDSNTQSFMQNRFGVDFSGVKIHSGTESVQMNRELNAKAFTVGSDIYFNEGQYNPGSSEGKHLLAHELTHTIQQNKTADRNVKLKSNQLVLQRKWKIIPRTTGTNPLNSGGQTDEKILEAGFKEICPLTSRSGNVISLGSGKVPASHANGCDCLSVIDSQIGSLFFSEPEVQVKPFGWSQTSFNVDPFVSVRHPEDAFNWGYWTGTTKT
ncbi:MAG: DUF4157 domain-containing protein, partial [Chitinophagales bacterium]